MYINDSHNLVDAYEYADYRVVHENMHMLKLSRKASRVKRHTNPSTH